MSVLPAGLVVGQHEGDLGPHELHRPGALLNRVLHQHIANPHEEVSSQQQPTRLHGLQIVCLLCWPGILTHSPVFLTPKLP